MIWDARYSAHLSSPVAELIVNPVVTDLLSCGSGILVLQFPSFRFIKNDEFLQY